MVAEGRPLLSRRRAGVRRPPCQQSGCTVWFSGVRVLHDTSQRQSAASHGALQKAGFARRYNILYAMKANRFAPLLTSLKASGLCGIDACSPQEVELAVSCGFLPSEISFTAGSLSLPDVAHLSRYQGLIMDCDSIHAIRTWGKLKPGTSIGIRINPATGVSREDNSKLQYAGGQTTQK